MSEIIFPTNNYNKYIDQAKQYLEQKNILKAIEILREAILLAKKNRDTINQGILLHNLALFQKTTNKISTAHYSATQAVKLLEHSNIPYLAEALLTLGSLERDLSKLKLAIKHHETALAIFEENKNTQGTANAFIELGLDYKDNTQMTEANLVLEKALSITSKERLLSLRAHTLIALGLVYEKLNDRKQAEYYYLESLKTYGEGQIKENDPLLLQNFHKNKAILLLNLGRLYDNQEKFFSGFIFEYT